jgi:hypothetical protein
LRNLILERELIIRTWGYCWSNSFRSRSNIASERHCPDKPFSQAEDRSSQPWGHEHTSQEDERDVGHKSKAYKVVRKKYFSEQRRHI